MPLFRALAKNMAPMTNADESPTNRLTLFWLNISLFIVSTLWQRFPSFSVNSFRFPGIFRNFLYDRWRLWLWAQGKLKENFLSISLAPTITVVSGRTKNCGKSPENERNLRKNSETSAEERAVQYLFKFGGNRIKQCCGGNIVYYFSASLHLIQALTTVDNLCSTTF